MKKILIAVSIISLFAAACNNSGKKETNSTGLGATADSLEKIIDAGHNTAMSKMGKLGAIKNAVQAALDSIAKLPAKAQEVAAPYKAKLQSVFTDIQTAESNMEKWMTEYNWDSAKDNLEARVKYLTQEKMKVSDVKDAVLNSLQKADSVLKSKF